MSEALILSHHHSFIHSSGIEMKIKNILIDNYSDYEYLRAAPGDNDNEPSNIFDRAAGQCDDETK